MNWISETHWDMLNAAAESETESYGETKQIPATFIIYPVYHLLMSIIPCLFGIYFNWCTAEELKKALAFVNNQARNEKYSRIMKLSSFFTWMLCGYFVVDAVEQTYVLWATLSLIVDERESIEGWGVGLRWAGFVDFVLYSVQSTFIAGIFYWFMTGKEDQ